MTRRTFITDLAAAADNPINGISDIKRGDDDGEVDFAFSHTSLGHPLLIRLVNMDIDGYPKHPGFLAFTSSDQVPPSVSNLLQNSLDMTENKSVTDALRLLGRKLAAALGPDEDENDADATMTDYEDDLEVEDSDDTARAGDQDDEHGGSINEDGELEYDIEDDDAFFDLQDAPQQPSQSFQPSDTMPERLTTDLRMAQRVGFKIGFVSNSIFSLSIRAQALGLSPESLASWGVDPSEYLVLLFQVQGKYAPAETFINLPPPDKTTSTVYFRFGKCADYKPSLVSALQALGNKKHRQQPSDHDREQTPGNKPGSSFRKHLISDSLDHWMQKDFASLLRLREYALTWDESIEHLDRLHKSAHINDGEFLPPPSNRGTSTKEELVSAEAPSSFNVDWFVAGTDEDLSNGRTSQRSLPLLAMQFALRYFAKSTNYCMVCHQKFESAFTAMRPYVCEEPLCLYQYMSLGFGQSLEHEIITQPLVVDLLISFCYSALAQDRLREYPKGLRILVPALQPLSPSPYMPLEQVDVPPKLFTPVTVDLANFTLWFELDVETGIIPIRLNDFVALRLAEPQGTKPKAKPRDPSSAIMSNTLLHCKVTDVLKVRANRVEVTFHSFSNTNVFGTASTGIGSLPADLQTSETLKDSGVPTSAENLSAEMYVYGTDLDELSQSEQRPALMTLLDTLPKVDDMRQHLLQPGVIDLAQYHGISGSALAFLKWIVASNRSLIMQINCPPSVCPLINIQALNKKEEAISGMGEDFVQFKFAQGSPDKERQFQDAVEKHTVKSKYPTLFAWHGSRIGNWHSIIRQGLDFSQILNGRAFGNGVYFSRDYHTSSGYSGAWSAIGSYAQSWPHSELRISSGISLCEIVNQRHKFVSQNPHYVVDKVDWIQCRYLFVKVKELSDSTSSADGNHAGRVSQTNPAELLAQDPSSLVSGPRGTLGIPKGATRYGGDSKPKVDLAQSDIEGSASIDLNIKDDLDRFLERGHETRSTGDAAGDVQDEIICTYVLDPSKTDFRPGQLDIESLPKLPSPTWADDQGRKVLGRELQKMQKVQASTAQHELGWYMDFERTENLFHWIVELHSFDPTLPFARDMKARKIPSIVLEIRYGRQFPISPPFVRIIKPRFLPFAEGGGGHVTAGGAMCMELLTNSGWSPVNSIESVILQVRMAICNREPTPARLSSYDANGSYGISEAIDAYKRVALRHGWKVPPDLEVTASGQ